MLVLMAAATHIGKAAKLAGVTVDTIRFYQKLGLIAIRWIARSAEQKTLCCLCCKPAQTKPRLKNDEQHHRIFPIWLNVLRSSERVSFAKGHQVSRKGRYARF
jgi:hypothetical protein